jgi:hypothetical protein
MMPLPQISAAILAGFIAAGAATRLRAAAIAPTTEIAGAGFVSSDGSGLVLPSNDFDSDGDGVPDWADGIGCFDDRDGGAIKEGRFAEIRFRFPDGAPVTDWEVRFDYSASDPGSIPPGDLRAVSFPVLDPTSKPAGIAPGHLRLWRKGPAGPRRLSRVASRLSEQGGDFILPDAWIAASQLSGDDLAATVFVEGIDPVTGGEPGKRIGIEWRFRGGEPIRAAGIPISVARGHLRVFVWRPYIFLPKAERGLPAGSRIPWKPDLTSPASVLADLITSSFYHADPLGKKEGFHGMASPMGHVFICCSYEGPAIAWTGPDGPASAGRFLDWTGQTNDQKMNGTPSAIREILSVLRGDLMWSVQPGQRNSADELQRLVKTLHGDKTFGLEPMHHLQTDPGLNSRFIVSHEWRLPARSMGRLIEYLAKRDYSRFGIDVDATGAPDESGPESGGDPIPFSGGGCGSFVGLCMAYAGIHDQSHWWQTGRFPLVPLRGVSLGFVVDWVMSGRRSACERLAGRLAAIPELQSFDRGLPVRYVDPAAIADWIEERQHQKKPATIIRENTIQ